VVTFRQRSAATKVVASTEDVVIESDDGNRSERTGIMVGISHPHPSLLTPVSNAPSVMTGYRLMASAKPSMVEGKSRSCSSSICQRPQRTRQRGGVLLAQGD
jgi:hypothetical protein